MNAAREPIGFIGLGIMGRPMAGHLLKAGYPLHVHTRTRAKAKALIEAGAAWCETPADVGGSCRVLITIVTDTPDVQAVLFGPNGAAERLQAGATVIDMSTISPDATRVFAERLRQRGITLLDAPVTGGDIGAQQGTLTIMVGGEREAFDWVRPVLEQMGRNIVHVGPSGAGQSMKACNQILCAVNMIGVCEALMLARRSGLDVQQLIETLSTGAGGSWALANLGPKIGADDLDPAFMIELIQKDLRIVQEAAQRQRVALPGTALAQQLFRAVEADEGGGRLGTQAMIRAIRKLAGETD
jgi:3-hydroxyisobutyrate dehydrogenase